VTGLYARVAAQVALRPRELALVCDGRAWTYAQFDAEVAAWCERLTGDGIGRASALGWLGHNSVAMLAALLACARRGARFVPLNWRLTAPELAQLAGHAGLDALHADAALADLADAVRALLPLPRRGPVAAAGGEGGAGDDLLLVYTSGTGGRPKGAIHTQAAMLANIDAAIDAQAFDVSTRALAVLPLFHVGGLCIQVLPVLAAGGAVKLHPRFDAAAWLADVQAWRPSTSLLVPATMRSLLEHALWAATDLSSLGFVNTGSSIVPRNLIDVFHSRGVPVCQVYGATETGPVTLVLRRDEALRHVGSVGRPALGVEVRLHGEEVHVRAPNLARGYHGEPESAAFADGWFRTGDLGRVDAQGYYEIVGRATDRIISGGENIDPCEIEQIASADPAVAEAAVVGVADAQWGEVPVLAVVLRPAAVADWSALRAALDAKLARFKHPRRIVVLDALPKTALGKVRKTELAQHLV
jgi:fatty-acyl-CoA synthase